MILVKEEAGTVNPCHQQLQKTPQGRRDLGLSEIEKDVLPCISTGTGVVPWVHTQDEVAWGADYKATIMSPSSYMPRFTTRGRA